MVEPRGSSSIIWYENWIKLDHFSLSEQDLQINNTLGYMEEFMGDKVWNYDLLQQYLLNGIVSHIRLSMNNIVPPELGDKTLYLLKST